MATKSVYLVCGVPGSGKTWACKQLQDLYTYVPHDEHDVAAYAPALLNAMKTSSKPIIAEAPFRVSALIDQLSSNGADVHPYFIIEMASTVRKRYEARESRAIPAQHIKNIAHMKANSFKHKGPRGTAMEIMLLLKGMGKAANA